MSKMWLKCYSWMTVFSESILVQFPSSAMLRSPPFPSVYRFNNSYSIKLAQSVTFGTWQTLALTTMTLYLPWCKSIFALSFLVFFFLKYGLYVRVGAGGDEGPFLEASATVCCPTHQNTFHMLFFYTQINLCAVFKKRKPYRKVSDTSQWLILCML